jgi:two-component system response regulator FixJ
LRPARRAPVAARGLLKDGGEMAEVRPIVYIVDDDPSVRRALVRLMGSVELEAAAFPNARDFLARFDAARPACLLLDLRLPQMSGLELQSELQTRGVVLPIIMITAYGEVSSAVRAMKAGAIDFVEKPFNDVALLERVHQALALSTEAAARQKASAALAARMQRLTPRQRDVLRLVIHGYANKQIAAELGLSAKTIEIHRANLMRRLEVSNVAELVGLIRGDRRDVDTSG